MHIAGLAITAALLLAQACAPRPAVVAPVPNPCLTQADSATPQLDTVVVALTRLEAIQFVLRHTSSNLVRLDCLGVVRPELATRWRPEDGGKSWVFTLEKPTAGVFRDTWERKRNGGIWLWPSILDVEVLDSATLQVRLDRSYRELPAEFSNVMLAISGGGFRTQPGASRAAGPVPDVTYLVPTTGGAPVIKVETLRANVDPRDALDFPRAGLLSPADVVITHDAATVAYARSRREFTVTPIAWALTYLLLTPVPGLPATTLPISDETQQNLVRDVVPGEVRAALPPFWWDSLPCQSTARADDPTSRTGPVLAFDESDPVARSLAERLAALTMSPGSRTMPVSRLAMVTGVFTGIANAFVLSYPRQRPICGLLTVWPNGSRVDPLVDLQAYVIARRGVPQLLLDGDGTIRFNAATGP